MRYWQHGILGFCEAAVKFVKLQKKEIMIMSKCIMVVDDDTMNLKMADFILKQYGYETVLASSGQDALDKLKMSKVDLILLDIEMPEMNGLETFKYLMLDYIEIPVMFLTASENPENEMEAVGLGAADYVKKPFMPQDLLCRVGKVFSENS